MERDLGIQMLLGIMVRTALNVWLPDRSPSRQDVWLIGIALFLVSLLLSRADRVAWLWVVAGFVVNALVMGPIAKSTVGQDISNWLQGFSSIGQKSVIALAILLIVVVAGETLPMAIGSGFVVGGCVFIALSLTVNFFTPNSRQERQALN